MQLVTVLKSWSLVNQDISNGKVSVVVRKIVDANRMFDEIIVERYRWSGALNLGLPSKYHIRL
jgi:ribosomal protein L18E